MSHRWKTTLGAAVLLAAASLVFVASAGAEGTAVLHGVLSENALVKKPITAPVVTVAGITATVDGSEYQAEGLPVGPQILTVTAPRHITSTRMVVLQLGDNTSDVALDLTVTETYRRYYAAYNHGRFSTAWAMVHPDVRGTMLQWGKPLTYSRYVWYMKGWDLPFLSMRIKSVSNVAAWKPRAGAGLPHARYSDLKRIVRVIRYRFGGDVVAERCSNQWLQVSGRWRIIFDAAFLAR